MAPAEPNDRAIHALRNLANQAADAAAAAPDEEPIYKLKPPADTPPNLDEHLPTHGPPSSADPHVGRRRVHQLGNESAAYRCLYCGYELDPGSDMICPECGTQFTRRVLDRWFDGDEQQRLERMMWLIMAILFLKACMFIPAFTFFARFIGALAAMYACWLSFHDKTETNAGMFGVAGFLASLVTLCLIISPAAAYPLVLDMAPAGLLLAAAVTDREGFELLGEHGYKRMALIIVFATPLVAGGLFGIESLVRSQITAAPGAAPGTAPSPAARLAIEWLLVALPVMLSLLVWLYVWWSLRQIQRVLFAPA